MHGGQCLNDTVEKGRQKELETIPIVPQTPITPPEIFLTWELCLDRDRDWDQGGIHTGAWDKSQGFRSSDTLKF